MASRKEKHARMLEKRAQREAAVAEVGRKSLEAAKAKRKLEEARMWEDAHQVHLKRNRFHDECPHCAKVKAQQAIDKLAKAAAKAKASERFVNGPVLTDEEARKMDQESADRVKGVLQEMGAIPKEPANA